MDVETVRQRLLGEKEEHNEYKNNLMADAVFEGGGVKGVGFVGAIAVAKERDYQCVNIAGTSAGAIVAALLAAGYSAAEMKDTKAIILKRTKGGK